MRASLSTWRLGVTVALIAVLFAVIAAAAVSLSRTPESIEVGTRERAAPTTRNQATSVTVVAGDSAGSIGRRLAASDVIASHYRFELLTLLLGWESRLEPGEYTFEPGLTTYEILRRIHFGETSPWRVVIPEGLRLEQVTERLAEATVVDAAAFRAVLEAPSADVVGGTLAARRPAGATLEGYLFPSAYTFPLDGTAEQAVRDMLQRLDDSITPQLWDLINESGRSLHEILTIASIIEREVVEDSERALVSAVIRNRLDAGMPLQMDSTVQYAVGTPGEWWKRDLLAVDLETVSPYNTYLSAELPPTPIASPGLASIIAAASPASVPYRYFVARGDGYHAFAVTYEEHQANVERFLGDEGGEQ